MYWQAEPCASPMTVSGTAHSTCTPCQVASGAPPGSSPVCFGSVSCKPSLTGDKTALPRSVSSGAGPLAHSALLCLALPSQSVWSGKFLLCISYSPQLGPVNWHDLFHSCVREKKEKELHAGCRTPHGSSETFRQQIEQLNCMQHQTRFSALLSRRSLCSCTSLCLPCGAPKSVSVLLNSHPLAWLKVAR